MANRRMDRVNQLILEEVAEVVQNELSDPAIGFVTVVAVRTAPDLSRTTVHVSVLGDAEAQEASIRALAHAAPFVRKAIAPRLKIRAVPKIEFELDHTAETATRISRLLHDRPAGGETPGEE